MNNINIEHDDTFIEQFNHALNNNDMLTSWDLFKLNYKAVKTTMTTSFDGLNVLNYLPHVDFLDYQIKTAEKVIEEMNGRAILADEVGLGKTIEAGLILKEYMVRGLVKNVLILVPASLVNQWVNELNEKFFIRALSFRKNYKWDEYPIYVTSIDTAKRSPHREVLEQLNFDMVIIDEAHKLKNEKTINYQFVKSLQKKYCLLLTATPIQNKLIELFNLVSILKPGYLGNYESFKQNYGNKQNDQWNNSFINKLIQKVMVRNTRKDTLLNDVKRNVETVWVDYSEEEQSVYNNLESLVTTSGLSKMNYLKQLCSSREACYLSLKKHFNNEDEPLLNDIASLPHHAKAKRLINLIKEIGNEKVIIFTQYHATQYYLQWYLNEHNISSVIFRGGFSASKKDWVQQLFKQQYQVLIATEAGGEGINLQFCHHLINYDLPWNPMRLEQRIGRIHRFGQQHNINVYNFALKNTMEEHLMNILYEKIDLFESTVGKLDHILAKLNIKFDQELNKIVDQSTSVGELKIKLDNLTSIIKSAEN